MAPGKGPWRGRRVSRSRWTPGQGLHGAVQVDFIRKVDAGGSAECRGIRESDVSKIAKNRQKPTFRGVYGIVFN